MDTSALVQHHLPSLAQILISRTERQFQKCWASRSRDVGAVGAGTCRSFEFQALSQRSEREATLVLPRPHTERARHLSSDVSHRENGDQGSVRCRAAPGRAPRTGARTSQSRRSR